MAFELAPLPYAANALEPHIDAKTMEIHHGKHHAGYTAKLNAALEGRDCLVGDSITNADIACCGYLFYPEPFAFDRKEFANIVAWMDRIATQPGWKHPYDLMPGSPADRA